MIISEYGAVGPLLCAISDAILTALVSQPYKRAVRL